MVQDNCQNYWSCCKEHKVEHEIGVVHPNNISANPRIQLVAKCETCSNEYLINTSQAAVFDNTEKESEFLGDF